MSIADTGKRLSSGHAQAPRRTARLRGLVLFLLLMVVWELVLPLVPQRATIVPTPSQIISTVVANYRVFLVAIRPTALEAITGFSMGAVLAIGLALAFVRWVVVEDALHNLAVTLNSLPYLAIIPMLVIWLGPGYAPKIVIAALASFFPILVNTTRGLKATDTEALELMHILYASWWATVFKVRFPMALPYLFAAFKISAPAAVLGATVGEWIGSKSGIGYLILTSMFEFNVLMLWSTMLVSALLAMSGYMGFAILEKVIVGRWSEPVVTEVE